MYTLELFQVIFNFPIASGEAVWFKKPVSAALSDLRKASRLRGTDELAGVRPELFYNRDEDTGNSENRYPLIQYGSVNGHASIMGINEGAASLHHFLAALRQPENAQFAIKHLVSERNQINLLDFKRPRAWLHTVKLLRQKKAYLLRHWLPLDSERYKNFTDEPLLKNLVTVLDECLHRQVGNMLRGTGLERKVIFKAQTGILLHAYPLEKVYHEKKMGFDTLVYINLDLPAGIGIGQVPGIGYGQLIPAERQDYY